MKITQLLHESAEKNESVCLSAKQVKELDHLVGQAWISVDDALPEYGSRVQVYDGKEIYIGNYLESDSQYPDGFWNDGAGSSWGDVTHWQYLPQPPKGAE